jgi:hypothetical protein
MALSRLQKFFCLGRCNISQFLGAILLKGQPANSVLKLLLLPLDIIVCSLLFEMLDSKLMFLAFRKPFTTEHAANRRRTYELM